MAWLSLPGSVAWRDVLCRWVAMQPPSLQKPLHDLAEEYVPALLDLLTPVLAGRPLTGGEGRGGEEGSEVSAMTPRCRLKPQAIRLMEIHLVSSCCAVLEVSVSACWCVQVIVPACMAEVMECHCTLVSCLAIAVWRGLLSSLWRGLLSSLWL